jgi:iron complex outermembrane recepter protein
MPSSITKLLWLICSIISPLLLTAQKQTITGKITDSKNNTPLVGVSVKVKGTGSGTTTNMEGVFKIQAKPGDVLQITMIGYNNASATVGEQSQLNIPLETNTTELSQIVLVGTRRAGRIKTETPVPVDVVNIGQVSLPTSRTDLTSIINYSAPSFNSNKQTGSDGADHIDLATLRGLGPD